MDLKTDHMIISVNAQNIFDKIQYAFMTKKNPQQPRGCRSIPPYDKSVYKKLTDNIILHGENLRQSY